MLAVNGFNLSMEDTRESTNRLCRTCPNDADTIQLKSPTPEYNVVYFQRGKQSRIFGEISLLPDAEDAHKC